MIKLVFLVDYLHFAKGEIADIEEGQAQRLLSEGIADVAWKPPTEKASIDKRGEERDDRTS